MRVLPSFGVSTATVPRALEFTPTTPDSDIHSRSNATHPCEDGRVLLESSYWSFLPIIGEKSDGHPVALPAPVDSRSESLTAGTIECCCVLHDGTVVYLVSPADCGDPSLDARYEVYTSRITDEHLDGGRELSLKKLKVDCITPPSSMANVFMCAVELDCFVACAKGTTVPFVSFVDYDANVRHHFWLDMGKSEPQAYLEHRNAPVWHRVDAFKEGSYRYDVLGTTGRHLLCAGGSELAALDLSACTWTYTDLPQSFQYTNSRSCVSLLDGIIVFSSQSNEALVVAVGEQLCIRTVLCDKQLGCGSFFILGADDEVQVHAVTYTGSFAAVFRADPLDRLRAARAPPSTLFLECLRRDLVPGGGVEDCIRAFEEAFECYERLMCAYEDTCSFRNTNSRHVALAASLCARARMFPVQLTLSSWEQVFDDPIINEVAGEVGSLGSKPDVLSLLAHRAPESLNDLVYNRIYTLELNYIATGCIPLRVTLDDLECPTAFRLLCRRAWRYSKHFSVEADGAKLFGLASCLTARDCSSVVGMKSTASVRSSLYAGPGALVAEHSPVAFVTSGTARYSHMRCPVSSGAPVSGRALSTSAGTVTAIEEVRAGGVICDAQVSSTHSHMAEVYRSLRIEGREHLFLNELLDSASAVRFGHGAVIVTTYDPSICVLLCEDGTVMNMFPLGHAQSSFAASLSGRPVCVSVGGYEEPTASFCMDGTQSETHGSVVTVSALDVAEGDGSPLLSVGVASAGWVTLNGAFSGAFSLYVVISAPADCGMQVMVLEVSPGLRATPQLVTTVAPSTPLTVGADGIRLGPHYFQASECGLALRSSFSVIAREAIVPLYRAEVDREMRVGPKGARFGDAGFAAISLSQCCMTPMEPARPPLPYDAGSHPFLSALSSGALARDGYGGRIRNELHVLSVFRELLQLFQSTFDPSAPVAHPPLLAHDELAFMQTASEYYTGAVLRADTCKEVCDDLQRLALENSSLRDLHRLKTRDLSGKSLSLAMFSAVRGVTNLSGLLNIIIPASEICPFLSVAQHGMCTPFSVESGDTVGCLWGLLADALAARARPSSRGRVVDHLRALAGYPSPDDSLEPHTALVHGSPRVLGPLGHGLSPAEHKRLRRLRGLRFYGDSLPLPPRPVALVVASPQASQPKLDGEVMPCDQSVFFVGHSGTAMLVARGVHGSSALPIVLHKGKARSLSEQNAYKRGAGHFGSLPSTNLICTVDLAFTEERSTVSRRDFRESSVSLPYMSEFTLRSGVQVGGELRLIGNTPEGCGVLSMSIDAGCQAAKFRYESVELPGMLKEELAVDVDWLQTLPLAPGVALVVGRSTSTVWRVDGASMAITAVDAPANCVYGDALLLGGVLAASKDHAYLLCDHDGEVVKKELADWSLPSEPTAVCICASGDHYYALASTQEGIISLRLK